MAAAARRVAVLRRHVVAGDAEEEAVGAVGVAPASTSKAVGRYSLNGGPLDADRAGASFDSARLRMDWDGEELVKFKDMVWQKLEDDPLFSQPVVELELERPALQRLTFQQVCGLGWEGASDSDCCVLCVVSFYVVVLCTLCVCAVCCVLCTFCVCAVHIVCLC